MSRECGIFWSLGLSWFYKVIHFFGFTFFNYPYKLSWDCFSLKLQEFLSALLIISRDYLLDYELTIYETNQVQNRIQERNGQSNLLALDSPIRKFLFYKIWLVIRATESPHGIYELSFRGRRLFYIITKSGAILICFCNWGHLRDGNLIDLKI